MRQWRRPQGAGTAPGRRQPAQCGLPETGRGSQMIDKGTDVGLPFVGAAPDWAQRVWSYRKCRCQWKRRARQEAEVPRQAADHRNGRQGGRRRITGVPVPLGAAVGAEAAAHRSRWSGGSGGGTAIAGAPGTGGSTIGGATGSGGTAATGGRTGSAGTGGAVATGGVVSTGA